MDFYFLCMETGKKCLMEYAHDKSLKRHEDEYIQSVFFIYFSPRAK